MNATPAYSDTVFWGKDGKKLRRFLQLPYLVLKLFDDYAVLVQRESKKIAKSLIRSILKKDKEKN